MHAKNKAPWNSLFSLISLFLGAALGISIIGINGIDPMNIGWFDGGDPLVHYLSWEFFRQSPWTIPIGLNPNYGLEIGSSIIYTDLIPLIAFLLKPFSPLLSTPFQYLGLWTLTCFTLQAYFGYLLARKITNLIYAQFLISAFFIFIPVFLFRVGFHTALVSQFLILWSLWIILYSKKFIWWMILLSISALINSYLFTMIFGLWLANSFDYLHAQKENYAKFLIGIALQFLTIFIIIIFIFWQSGYFAISSTSYGIGGFGVQRMNLLAPFNAQSWSYILPNIPEAHDDLIGGPTGLDFYARRTESFQYLGLGFILLIAFSIKPIYLLRHLLFQQIKIHRFLFLMLLFFTVFAISNQIGVASFQLTIPLSDTLYIIASTWRASGRFFWPIIYIGLFLCLWSIFQHYPKKGSMLILAICLSIQIIDTSAGWRFIYPKMSSISSSSISSPLKNVFWTEATKKYSSIKTYPLQHNITQNHWGVFGAYALEHHLGTNISYLARLDNQKIKNYNKTIENQIRSGTLEEDSFFILDERSLPIVYQYLKAEDLLAVIDGFYVLAPGWHRCNHCSTESQMGAKSLNERFIKPELNQNISFGKYGNGYRYLVGGFGGEHSWGYPEEWGTWMTRSSAEITIPIPKIRPKFIEIVLRFPRSNANPETRYQLHLYGEPQIFTMSSNSDTQVIKLNLPDLALRDGFITIQFAAQKLIIPKDIGLGDDTRSLGLGISSLTFMR